MRGQIVVARVNDAIAARGVYVGRSMRGRDGLSLGNQWQLHDESERAHAIARYERWLEEKVNTGDRGVVGALDALAARFRAEERLVLVCWCRSYGQDAPVCHADVIARVVRERVACRDVSNGRT